jgi:hypothetical protein
MDKRLICSGLSEKKVVSALEKKPEHAIKNMNAMISTRIMGLRGIRYPRRALLATTKAAAGEPPF